MTRQHKLFLLSITKCAKYVGFDQIGYSVTQMAVKKCRVQFFVVLRFSLHSGCLDIRVCATCYAVRNNGVILNEWLCYYQYVTHPRLLLDTQLVTLPFYQNSRLEVYFLKRANEKCRHRFLPNCLVMQNIQNMNTRM